ncbi:hypothetical protein BN7_1213 [Wickerhamomyces ciferrii]|uniref:Protein phosphatase methylesterase 1 n=1 Tax=Wickerhamomyces ciferrii (strain ATCC 14091 / BCRC 22168 / CBS 111 / JCM 3599 / NBRC 0793 / NRRL Y-1031 F-60-10) TaxID=1206466 RepID=K0KHM1_WICCF|nr:uncharacterized protein BN7_1213 [Wickerhamomyces ciferrii]CCH41672.1 hypothetical protein BN7_1213 [Wickerhamomyces ciferrii]
MSDFQRKLFQRKLKDAEKALGFDFSEESEESGEQVTVYPKWSEFYDLNEVYTDDKGNQFNTYFTPPKNDKSPVFIFHHGAGSSGLSFALLSRTIREQMSKENRSNDDPVAGVFSFDARGHGQTEIVSNPNDFSLKAFTDDFIWVLKELIKRHTLKNSIFAFGHSLGGSIVTNAFAQLEDAGIKGVGMFDIVEDIAIYALDSMGTYLKNLPKTFNTLEDAISWHIKLGHVKNRESALISIPSYFKKNVKTGKFEWIMDLHKTEDYWHDWFTGLSKKFVDLSTSKLLILAGTDNLDKELMIGQMQGKYQLVVFQDTGHFLQEDTPSKTAITIIDFWRRNDNRQVIIKSTWGSKK